MPPAEEDETTPLIADEIAPESRHPRGSRRALTTIIAAFSLILILSISSHISDAPLTAILEDIVCEKYYASHPDDGSEFFSDPESKCKIEPIQSEVAFINGWKDTFEAAPGTTASLLSSFMLFRYTTIPALSYE